MLRSRALSRAAAFFVLVLWASPAAADNTIGGSCSGGGSSAQFADGNNTWCNGSTWQYPGYTFGTLASTLTGCSGTNAGQVQFSGTTWFGCTGSNPWVAFTTASTPIYDIAIFMPTTPGPNVIVRVASARNATFPASLTGSECIAKAGATSSTAITVNRVHSGTTTAVATITFAASGSANQTCTFTAASPITTVPGDVIEFVFPATPDATLANISITLAGTHT
jgi:hypothetical protein